MQVSQLLILLLFGVAANCQNVTLPGCLDPPYNNAIAQVITEILEQARPYLETGIPNLGVPPLDPLGPLPPIVFDLDSEALTLEGSVNDTVVANLAQFLICQVDVKVGVSQEVYFEFRLDNFHMDGLYRLDGLALSLFPIFGDGNYVLDTYESGFSGFAKIKYNVFQDTISISDLKLDIFFEELELFFECILGCGDMADFINGHLGDIGEVIFNSVWDFIEPILSSSIESILNEALKNVSISDLLPRETNRELGNANVYLDAILWTASRQIKAAGLDPMALPDAVLELGDGAYADIKNGSFSGLSTVRRSGTATVDSVTDWIFLYANVAVGKLEAVYPGVVVNGEETDSFTASLSLEIVDIYLTARGDTFSGILDLDQFVMSELGPVNIELEGMGVLGWMAESVSEGLINLFLDDIQALLTNQLKDAIQDALNENPWPTP